MKLSTYLNFGGNCEEAFRFYQKHLGGTIRSMMTHEQMPGPSNVGPEWKKKILHARLDLGDCELMGSDIPSYQPMRSVYISLSTESDAEAERIWKLLSDRGEVFMPIQETFFATRFGQLRDRFGISWMILHERPAPARV
jgi:PhnB protein